MSRRNFRCAQCRRGGASISKRDKHGVVWRFHSDCWARLVNGVGTDDVTTSTADVLEWVRR